MGQALYRKYRPKKLSQVVGQEHITDTLQRALKKDKVSHAYLFTGPRGVGKTSVARILAHEINNLPYTDESIHLDIIEIDAASNRRIDEIRDLREKIHIAPSSAKYKVYIIDEAHMLTKEAFNALLKTLEEPPAHVIFILATTEAHKLPDTIVSRTQKFTFKPIGKDNAVEHLRNIVKQEGLDVHEDALKLLSEHGGGSFRDSISLLDQIGNSKKTIGLSDVEQFIGVAPSASIDKLMRDALTGTPAEVAQDLAQLTVQGITPGRIAKQLSASVRSSLLRGDPAISPVLAHELLHSFLQVLSHADPAAVLELALFKVNLTDQPRTTQPNLTTSSSGESTALAITSEPTPSSPVMPPPTHKSVIPGKIKENSTAPILPEELDWWPQLLMEIKKHNNTLYGMLRMGHPVLEKDNLKLSFTFGFHVKKIGDSKTADLIKKTIKNITGRTLNVSAIQKTGLNHSTKSESDKLSSAIITDETEDNLQTVSSIFGGGEVL